MKAASPKTLNPEAFTPKHPSFLLKLPAVGLAVAQSRHGDGHKTFRIKRSLPGPKKLLVPSREEGNTYTYMSIYVFLYIYICISILVYLYVYIYVYMWPRPLGSSGGGNFRE